MKSVEEALNAVHAAQRQAGRPLAVILAGHNGAGKSTLWDKRLAPQLQLPLVNADRMMLSILPEPDSKGLPPWARILRDTDTSWMRVAQRGVQAFIAEAMGQKVAFAMETVFSHAIKDASGRLLESKIDLVRQMQAAGYFVLLVFVGLSNVNLSIGRVISRRAQGGHDVPIDKLLKRFPLTQEVMRIAMSVADACLLVDNSRGQKKAFTVCRVQVGTNPVYDIRNEGAVPTEIAEWLPCISPPPQSSWLRR